MSSSLPLIVAGGGIGGLAAAMVLAQDGHAVTVLEQASAFGEIGAAVQARLAGGEVVEGPALVGADGLWSRIREAVVGDGKPRISGHIAYRAVLKHEEVPAHLWSDRRVTLRGDAAHPMLQYLAQGAGQAIEDAVVLREALRSTGGDQMFQSGRESAGFAGLKWMSEGIDPRALFA